MPAIPLSIVFDLDGTLADTARDLVPVLNRITAAAGLRPLEVAEIGHVVGHGSKAMIERAFELGGTRLTPRTLERLHAAFLRDYEVNLAANTVLFEGAEAVLERFVTAGWRMSVCTNKPAGMAKTLLEKLGIASRFSAITGGDSFAFKKPDPRHLLETIRLSGGKPGRAVMVGDSISDIKAARSAGVPIVAVDFGYSATPVAELGPDIVISHFDELWDAVAKVSG